MSTPELVVESPHAPVQMPGLPAHQVALLIRGLALYQQAQEQAHAAGILRAKGFTERHTPAAAAQQVLRERLDAWLTEHHLVAPADGDVLAAVWPEPTGPSRTATGADVELGTLTLDQVWRLRLATDWCLIAELNAAKAAGGELAHGAAAPLAAAQQTLFATLRAHGVDDPE